jgi:hypothetical protein
MDETGGQRCERLEGDTMKSTSALHESDVCTAGTETGGYGATSGTGEDKSRANLAAVGPAGSTNWGGARCRGATFDSNNWIAAEQLLRCV